MSLNESSIVFVCFGRVISQNLFRNFTFEIIDYFKCHSNRSNWPHLNQMLEFSLNRPTTSCNWWRKQSLLTCPGWDLNLDSAERQQPVSGTAVGQLAIRISNLALV